MTDTTLLLCLIGGHLLGDFYFQPNRWVNERNNKRSQSRYLPLHALVHAALTALVVAIHTTSMASVMFGAVFMFLGHFLTDLAKSYLNAKLRWFLLDQAAHLLWVVMLWLMLTHNPVWQVVESWFRGVSTQSLLVLLAYLVVMKPASVGIAALLARWSDQFDGDRGQDQADSGKQQHTLASAGEHIGYLERGLIVTFLLVEQISAVGFVLAAKSIFRFGDLKGAHDRKFTEYVMLGTFSSIAVALMVGLLVKMAI